MGYMTTITILNDAWHVIEKNPEQFVGKISDGMHGINSLYDRKNSVHSYGIGNHCNPMQVAKSHHADDFRFYVTYGNAMVEYDCFGARDIKLEFRKDIYKKLERILKEEKKAIREIEKASK